MVTIGPNLSFIARVQEAITYYENEDNSFGDRTEKHTDWDDLVSLKEATGQYLTNYYSYNEYLADNCGAAFLSCGGIFLCCGVALSCLTFNYLPIFTAASGVFYGGQQYKSLKDHYRVTNKLKAHEKRMFDLLDTTREPFVNGKVKEKILLNHRDFEASTGFLVEDSKTSRLAMFHFESLQKADKELTNFLLKHPRPSFKDINIQLNEKVTNLFVCFASFMHLSELIKENIGDVKISEFITDEVLIKAFNEKMIKPLAAKYTHHSTALKNPAKIEKGIPFVATNWYKG